MMKCSIVGLLLLLAIFQPAWGQESWVLLQEYDSPAYWAQGLYYDGKLLWHVDSDSGTGENTIYTMNPYNLEVIDSIPSPVDQPWGITATDSNFWLTNGHWGDPTPELVRIRTDTFAVDTSIEFEGYYFYGMTWDSVGGNLWISALEPPNWDRYILEFNPDSCEVVQWHFWPSNWSLGIQYWQGQLWTNTQDWYYPDFTMIMDINTWQMSNSLMAPDQAPEGIATNGVVWWLSYLRLDYHCIQKVIPPGVGVHDIAAYHSPLEDSSEIHTLIFSPTADFINYGSFPEFQVPFVLRVKEMPAGVEIYYDSLIYEPEIEPEEIVHIIYAPIILQPDTEYKFIFYSNLQTDQYRNNDTLKVTVRTASVIHDLAILTVLEPDSFEQQVLLYPEIRVQNVGDFVEPVAPVHLDIRHPNGSHSIFDAQVINFPPFSPPDIGEYLFTFDGQLPFDFNPGNDYRTVNCIVGMVHDVAPIQITSPEIFEPFGPITPSVVVANLGNFSENAFYTDCSIRDSLNQEIYWNHAVCPPLNPGQQYEMEFPTFAAPSPGMYIFIFVTQLGTDNVPENDSLPQASGVGIFWDIAPTVALNPGAILTPGALIPTAVMTNLGTEPAYAFYVYCLVDTESAPLYVLPQWMVVLEAGQSDTLTFQTISISQPALYRFRFITAWNLDINPANDTLEFWAELPLGIDENRAGRITEFQVDGGYPNPFNAQTSLIVYLPMQTQVGIDLYNLTGQRMRNLDFGQFPSGTHQITIEAEGLPSGIFLAVVRAGAWQKTLKLALLK
jgi:hypothetical protein